MIFGLGHQELLIVLLLVLLLFGAQKLPELARGLGRSAKEFKKAQAEVENAGEDVTRDPTSSDEKRA